jgi:hypothetical protein
MEYKAAKNKLLRLLDFKIKRGYYKPTESLQGQTISDRRAAGLFEQAPRLLLLSV